MNRLASTILSAALLTALVASCSSAPASSDSSAAGTSSGSSSGSGSALPIDTEYTGVLSALPTTYPEPEPAKQDLKIGWLSPNAAQEVLGSFGDAIQIATEQRGGTLVTLDAALSPDTQVTQMQQLIDQKVDAIIVAPLDAKALEPVLKRAAEAKIPVLAWEANPDPATTDLGGFTSQVITGTDYLGFATAQEMARQQPGGKVVVAGFVVPVPYLAALTEAQTKWAKEFGLDVVDTVENQGDDVGGGSTAVAGALAQFPDTQGVLAFNDATAIGGALAGREAGLKLTTIGVNGASDSFAAIENGQEWGTLQWPIVQWAEQLTAGAYDAVQKPDVPLPLTVFPAKMELITSENIGQAKTLQEQLDAMRG